MGKVVILEGIGEAETLKIRQLEDKQPVKNQLLIKNHAIGINYDDLLIRLGKKTINKFPIIPGYEASGEIVAIGEEVKGFTIGDRVSYFSPSMGSYCETKLINEYYAVSLPEEISYKLSAAGYFKGMVAHMLATRVFLTNSGTAVLIHNATGGVEHILAQWANMRGAVVIGTVDSDEKKNIALKFGCHKALNYKTEDWPNEVLKITNGIGVSAVYDSLGVSIFEKSLDCLMEIGIMVHYNCLEGKVDAIRLSKLHKKSLFLTYPSVFHYKKNKMELILSANEFFELLKQGKIKINSNSEYTLDNVQNAHKKLESGVSGSMILLP